MTVNAAVNSNANEGNPIGFSPLFLIIVMFKPSDFNSIENPQIVIRAL